ncbi:hypothetical protein [Neisseria sp. 74A18]|nr:hypothetical protein [Neisseria sp. 74A18]
MSARPTALQYFPTCLFELHTAGRLKVYFQTASLKSSDSTIFKLLT